MSLRDTLRYLREYRLEDIRQMLENGRAEQARDDSTMAGKVCLVTGATSGVGLAAAQAFAEAGATLILVNRDRRRSEALCDELRRDHGIECSYYLADFARLDQLRELVARLAGELPRLDVLVNNAGMHSTRLTRTAEGRETVFCVNHLASFIITHELLELLRRSAPSRIVQVNSQGHRFGGLDPEDLDWQKRHYTGLRGYGASKTAQLLTVWEFDLLLRGSGVTINAMHPGAVLSGIGRNNGALYRWHKRNFTDRGLADPAVAGSAIRWLASSPDLEGISGRYFNLTREERPAPQALDRGLGKRIWEASMRLGGLT
ncbi:MAG TPA: SDR family NAD(P)-dependent oxidoreductase [Rectinemataceae bacterium]|nr:SDR family NAD(P)-dependent oxidoreductase [Rectinemataceae bacterium]